MQSWFQGAGVTARGRAGALGLILSVALAACASPSTTGPSTTGPSTTGPPTTGPPTTGPSRVPEGDQPTAGQGWRLLGHAAGVGEVYRTGVATTDGQLTALWRESALGGQAPSVDWQAEIAVWFGAVYGISCPVRLDGVVVDGTTMHGQIVVPGSGPDSACTADANPHSFVVAVKRTLLPAGPFVVQLNATDPPPGFPKERTVVAVDLSAPGSIASAAQLQLAPAASP